MNFFTQILGRTKPTSANVTKLLSEAGADLEANRKRLAEAEAVLQRVAVLTAEGHAAAETEQAEARRAIVRLEAKIVELQKGLAEAQEVERLEALKARAEAVRLRVEVEAPKLLDRFDVLGAELSRVVDDYAAINVEVASINAELIKAGLDPIENADFRYRREPDVIIPEVRTKRKKWVRLDRWTGVEQDVTVFSERDGRLVPNEAGAREVEVEVVTPEQRRPGRWLEGLAENVRLPPARVGSAWHWPKG